MIGIIVLATLFSVVVFNLYGYPAMFRNEMRPYYTEGIKSRVAYVSQHMDVLSEQDIRRFQDVSFKMMREGKSFGLLPFDELESMAASIDRLALMIEDKLKGKQEEKQK